MFVIAKNTFKEIIRDKFIHIILFLSIMIFALSYLLGSLSFEEQKRILIHLGFMGIHISLIGISMFIGSAIIVNEIERQTCLIVLARPISRVQFYVGKWLGALLVNCLIAVILMFVLWLISGMQFSLKAFAQIVFGSILESTFLLTLTLFGSLFLRPTIAFFMAVAVYLFGNWLEELIFFAKKTKNVELETFANFTHKVFPQLYRTNWRSFTILQEDSISGQTFLLTTLHMIGWVGLFLVIGCLYFRRKDLV